ncbi:hypothetical protein HC928_01535 [bacterium]|nr:hypothetical protein [bacterium]
MGTRVIRSGLMVLMAVALIVPSLPTIVSAQAGERCFPETGFCISGRIREYWEANNGLEVFGLPVTPQRRETIEGRSLEVQWFQRNRLELHPQNARPFDVLLGRLGADRLAQQSINPDIYPKSTGEQRGCRFFPETGHNVCGRMLRKWRELGLELDGQPGKSEAENLALFGLPLSNEHTLTLSDGAQRTVQWFERGRFEIHNSEDNPSDTFVLFGLLGNEILETEKLLDGATPPPPMPVNTPQSRLAFETNSGLNTRLFPATAIAQARFIHAANVFGSERTALTRNHVQPDRRPTWSPDGTRIAFESARDVATTDIYVMNADGSGMRRLTNTAANAGFPAWSPDGRRIAYASDSTGDYEIYTINADGSGSPTRVTNNAGAQDIYPTWSPDGSQIAYTANGGLNRGEWDVYVISASGGTPRNLTRTAADDQSPHWSSTGQIAFKSNRSGLWQIFTMNADGSNQRNMSNSNDNDEEPAWSPDGRQIAYQTGKFGPSEIFVMDANGANKRNVTNSPASEEAPTWSPPLRRNTTDPCPFIPEPVNARVSPRRCVRAGEEIVIDIFGFLANERFEINRLGLLANGNPAPSFREGGTVNQYGEAQFRPGSLAPGDYRFEFNYFFGQGAFFGSTVYIRIEP